MGDFTNLSKWEGYASLLWEAPLPPPNLPPLVYIYYETLWYRSVIHLNPTFLVQLHVLDFIVNTCSLSRFTVYPGNL